VTGPGDGWPPSWDDDGAEPGGDPPWSWTPGPEEHLPEPDLEPAGLPAEPDPADPAEPPDAAGPAEPLGLPTEPPADWSDPAGWTDQPHEAGGPDPFPPALAVDVSPTDGGPWADPDLLGAGTPLAPPDPPGDSPAALRADLAAADGDPGADWAALRGSDDPAVRTLAAFWRPTD
jgi:hypothetical protein